MTMYDHLLWPQAHEIGAFDRWPKFIVAPDDPLYTYATAMWGNAALRHPVVNNRFVAYDPVADRFYRKKTHQGNMMRWLYQTEAFAAYRFCKTLNTQTFTTRAGRSPYLNHDRRPLRLEGIIVFAAQDVDAARAAFEKTLVLSKLSGMTMATWAERVHEEADYWKQRYAEGGGYCGGLTKPCST